MRDRPDRPRERNLAKEHRIGREAQPAQGGHKRRRGGEIGGRFADTQAPRDIEINVVLPELDAGVRFENGENHGEPRIVPADNRAARRAERARRDKSLDLDEQRLVPSIPANTAAPGAVASRDDRNNAEGFATSASPRPVISKTPISSVGPNRFFTARRMRKFRPPSLSNEITASTICSTTRGPAIWPSLVTCPTRITAAPVVFAKRIKACAAPRTWPTVPGVDSISSVHIV